MYMKDTNGTCFVEWPEYDKALLHFYDWRNNTNPSIARWWHIECECFFRACWNPGGGKYHVSNLSSDRVCQRLDRGTGTLFCVSPADQHVFLHSSGSPRWKSWDVCPSCIAAHVFLENLPWVLNWSFRKSPKNNMGVNSKQKLFDLGFVSCICYTVVF